MPELTDDPDPRDIVTLNIISSHKISSKTKRCISLLYTTDITAGSPQVIGLRAKSAVASKAITIAEIVKRQIGAQGDKWYQYTQLSSVLDGANPAQAKHRKRRRKYENNAENLESGEGGNDDDDDDDPFVKMEEGRPKKVIAIPVLTIYISRTQLPTFAKLYGYIL